MRLKIYGPMYTQYSFVHVFLFTQITIKQVSEQDQTGAEVDSTRHAEGEAEVGRTLRRGFLYKQTVLAQVLIFAC